MLVGIGHRAFGLRADAPLPAALADGLLLPDAAGGDPRLDVHPVPGDRVAAHPPAAQVLVGHATTYQRVASRENGCAGSARTPDSDTRSGVSVRAEASLTRAHGASGESRVPASTMVARISSPPAPRLPPAPRPAPPLP